MSDPTTKDDDAPRFESDCPLCRFAYECGSRAWHCDGCGSSHDLRRGAQFDMLRDDATPNRAVLA